MGINPNLVQITWRAIHEWMNQKKVSPTDLTQLTGYPLNRIVKGIKDESQGLTSDFVHACVDVFGLRNARNRSLEDATDLLTDEECIQLLTSILTATHRQGNFWDN